MAPGKRTRSRANGAGTVYKVGKRYRAQLVVDWTVDGKPIRWSAYADTKRAAEDLLAEAKVKERRGLLVVGPQATLAEYADAWLDSVALSLRESTLRSYRSVLRNHVLPVLGHYRLDQLTPDLLEAFYVERTRAGIGKPTLGLAHAVLRTLLNRAERREIVPRNVARLVDAPKSDTTERPTLSVEQARTLLAAARDDPLEALYVLALTTGLRQGELLGLKWGDFDLAAATVAVRRQTQQGGQRDPKSDAGRRELPLTGLGVAAVKHQRARQAAQRLLAGERWQDRGFVFTDPCGGPLDRRSLVDDGFRPLLRRAGLPRIRFHDLRHTTGRLLIKMGYSLKVVQAILGHSDIATTANVYGHVEEEGQREAMVRLNALLSEKIVVQ